MSETENGEDGVYPPFPHKIRSDVRPPADQLPGLMTKRRVRRTVLYIKGNLCRRCFHEEHKSRERERRSIQDRGHMGTGCAGKVFYRYGHEGGDGRVRQVEGVRFPIKTRKPGKQELQEQDFFEHLER